MIVSELIHSHYNNGTEDRLHHVMLELNRRLQIVPVNQY